MDPSHDLHEALLLVRTRPSSSPGVVKLCDPADDSELEDNAGNAGTRREAGSASWRAEPLADGLRDMLPNIRDDFLDASVGRVGCSVEVLGSGDGFSDRLAPKIEDRARMIERDGGDGGGK